MSLISEVLTEEEIGMYRLLLTLEYPGETESDVYEYKTVLSIMGQDQTEDEDETDVVDTEEQKGDKD